MSQAAAPVTLYLTKGGPGMIYAGVDIAKADHVIGAVDAKSNELGRPMRHRNTRKASSAASDGWRAWGGRL